MKKSILILLIILSYIFSCEAQVFQGILRKAESGDIEAIKTLANGYLKGNVSFQINYSDGFKWAKKGAELGDAECQFILADCYFNGLGTEINLTQAMNWLDKSAALFYPDALYKKALIYDQDQNYDEAFKLFSILKEKYDFPESYYHLGIYHFLELGNGTKLSVDPLLSKKQNIIMAYQYLGECIQRDADKDGTAYGMLFDLLMMPYYSGDFKDMNLKKNAFVAMLDEGISKFPENLMLYYKKGELLLFLDEIGDAKILWEDIQKRDPNAFTSSSKLAAAFGGSIDYVIPTISPNNVNTYALVIANENYKRVPNVPHAINDGLIFSSYLNKTFGLPQKNITYLEDASLNDIKFALNTITKSCLENPNENNIIIYYAGHGVPDESNSEAYLLPIDGYGTDPTSGLKLDDLYSHLSNLPVQSAIVLLDACFSGSKRDGGMLLATRGITIKPKVKIPDGKLVVFSATSEDETAFPLEEQRHGLFTYTLLRKIQESDGNISWGELADYVIEKVKIKSIDLTGKIQTPSVSVSPSLKNNWRSLNIQ